MAKATITLHLPAHRERALQLQAAGPEATQAYDANIGAYLKFLEEQAQTAGYTLKSDRHEGGAVFSIAEHDHSDKKAAHDWLETQPDIWNWIP